MVTVKALIYSMYGRLSRKVKAVAEGARNTAGAQVQLIQVPELVPEDVPENSRGKTGNGTI